MRRINSKPCTERVSVVHISTLASTLNCFKPVNLECSKKSPGGRGMVEIYVLGLGRCRRKAINKYNPGKPAYRKIIFL